jgi:formylglycine-generating enzyme required for sulfatase activity
MARGSLQTVGAKHVIIGGGWDRGSKGDLRNTYRSDYGPDRRDEKIGFRVVLVPSGP